MSNDPLTLARLDVLFSDIKGVAFSAVRRSWNAEQLVPAGLARPDLLILDAAARDPSPRIASDVDVPPLVAFLAASTRDAGLAFDMGALDFLLKPIESWQMRRLIERAQDRLALVDAARRTVELDALVEQLRNEAVPDQQARFDHEIWVRQRSKDHVRILVDQIDWITVEDDYSCIRTGGREHLLRVSLDRLVPTLDPQKFARIHRSTVVNLERVARLTSDRAGAIQVLLNDGTRLPVGRVYARKLRWRRNFSG